MNEILKQRLVGALILVALGVIFWPIIFVQPERDEGVKPPAIPPPPGINATPIEAPDDAGLRESPSLTAHDEVEAEDTVQPVDTVPPEEVSAPGVEDAQEAEPAPVAAAPQERAPRTEAPEKLAMDSDGVPIAWTLQVATLSNSEKADALRRKLLAMNHKAYVAEVRRDGKTLYRVCVGPRFERAELERLKSHIDSTFGVKALVARYVP